MVIIPAIDILDGQCVRLQQGEYQKKIVYAENPVEVARRFAGLGFQRLHLVDLDGAKSRRVVNLSVLAQIAAATDLEIDFGGGINSREDLQEVFDAGARQVNLGTVAIRAEATVRDWIDEYGPDRFILSADLQNGRAAVAGWQEKTGVSWQALLQTYAETGLNTCICTDISKDGMLAGPALDLYRNIRQAFPEIRLIASGGIRSLEDLHELQSLGCAGAVIGKAIYEKHLDLDALAQLNQQWNHA